MHCTAQAPEPRSPRHPSGGRRIAPASAARGVGPGRGRAWDPPGPRTPPGRRSAASVAVLVLDAGPDLSASAPCRQRCSTQARFPLRGSAGSRPSTPGSPPGRTTTLLRGRVVGGSSAINGGYFIRATDADVAGWAEVGATDWPASEVAEAWRRSESDLDLGAGPLHGGDGPIPVTRSPGRALGPVTEAFFAACDAAGHTSDPDKNDGHGSGFGPIPHNIVDGTRVNAAMAYLDPARGRSNLEIRGSTPVRRVLIEGGVAVGVEAVLGGSAGPRERVAGGAGGRSDRHRRNPAQIRRGPCHPSGPAGDRRRARRRPGWAPPAPTTLWSSCDTSPTPGWRMTADTGCGARCMQISRGRRSRSWRPVVRTVASLAATERTGSWIFGCR